MSHQPDISRELVEPTQPTVDAVVLAWLAEPLLRASVEALLTSTGVTARVILVDNGCTTDDVDVLEHHPGVTVLRPGRNLGFSGGCNLGVAAGQGQYVALVNGDAVVEPHTLARLIAELAEPTVAMAAASVRLAEDRRRLNSRGNVVHILGLSWVGGLGELETRTAPTDTAGAMGACVVTSRAHWNRLGGFYEPYFAYHEDADLSIRTWQQGLRVVNVPDAVAIHRYEFSRNPAKLYLAERNRLLFVATVWGPRALVLLAPVLVALEIAVTLMAMRQGWVRDKARGWVWLWRHRQDLRARRRFVRHAVTVPDREWMRVLSDTIDTPLISIPWALRQSLNSLVRGYWRVASRLV